ncbi:lipase 3-like isoform X2 [Anticarsia gemmatalis]
MHGILESSDSWLIQGPNLSLAYVLADEGFDVWMGNSRGNKHSIKHKTLNYTSAGFWKFTWEEIGLYDLPAMVDYILEETGRESLYYIGHSQGTTSSYVMLSMKPEYNAKVKILFSLAPEAWMGSVQSPIIKIFSPAINLLGSLLLDYTGAASEFFERASFFLCGLTITNCENILYAMSGYESKINQTLLPVIFGHMPTGSSTLQFVHYGQLVNSDRFCRYDHGAITNMKLYGQTTPPDYDLSKIVAPNVIYYSSKDWLSHPDDVDKLRSRLPNVLAYVYFSDFTHMDYVYAAEARDVIYMRIIAQINKFEADGELNDVPKSSLLRRLHGSL